jgi:membrane protein implicated in regulation of membrane protease activity
MNEERPEASHEAPLFCKARFGPSTVGLLSFIAVAAILYYSFNMMALALLIGGVGVLFFSVKSMERIELIRIQERNLIGEMCRVVKPVQRGQPGIVRMVKPDGTTEPELWSAESTHEVEAGKKALVIGTRSIVLLIDPLTQEASPSSSQTL